MLMVNWACVAAVAWVLPNALILYKARALFAAREKPGHKPGFSLS